jgi:hypothetical protein
MRLGIWCPAPLSIRPDRPIKPAFDALTRHGGDVDKSYLYAVDVLKRAEQLGFEITLIAQRFFGPDLDSWMLAAALSALASEVLSAVASAVASAVDSTVAWAVASGVTLIASVAGTRGFQITGPTGSASGSSIQLSAASCATVTLVCPPIRLASVSPERTT